MNSDSSYRHTQPSLLFQSRPLDCEQPHPLVHHSAFQNHSTSVQIKMSAQNQIQMLRHQAQQYRLLKYYNQKLGLSKKYYCQLKKMKITKTSQTCTICQEPFLKQELVIQLPCKHIFHKQNCVKGWLRVSSKCAICKFDLQQYFKSKAEHPEQNESTNKKKDSLISSKQNEKKCELKNWLQKEFNGNKIKENNKIQLNQIKSDNIIL